MVAVAKNNDTFYMAQSCTEETFETVKSDMEADAIRNGVNITVEPKSDEDYFS